MKKNDIIEFEITDITGQGSGIGRVDGMAVFVPMTAVGDKITARILKVKKNYAFGKLESIIEESKMRIEPDCKCYSKCGGCAFRHITYEEEFVRVYMYIDIPSYRGGDGDYVFDYEGNIISKEYGK